MNERIAPFIELIERRTSLLRALALQLVDGRKDFLALDSDGVFARISAQEELCRQIRAVDSALARLASAAGAGDSAKDSASANELRAALAAMKEAQAELAQLNRIHAAYLRRCNRTVRLFANFFRGLSLTYAPSKAGEYPAFAGSR